MENSEATQFVLKMVTTGMAIVCVVVGIVMVYQEKVMTIATVSIPAGLILLVAGLILFGAILPGSARHEKQWWKSKWIWVGGAITLGVVVFGIVQPFVWMWKYGKPPPEGILDLSTLLTILLTLLALGVAGFGTGTYVILAGRIRSEARKSAGIQMDRAATYILATTGYTSWLDYKTTTNPEHLNTAIFLTERAYSRHGTRLDEEDYYNQKLICEIKNNLGYYLAERARIGKKESGDEKIAKECGKYIWDRLEKYPEKRKDWKDTTDFIQKYFP